MAYYAAFEIDTSNGRAHKEKITVRSNEDQRVYISGYTYDSQHIRNGACDNYTMESYMYFTHSQTNQWYWPLYGENHTPALKMKKGSSVTVELHAYWAPEDLL